MGVVLSLGVAEGVWECAISPEQVEVLCSFCSDLSQSLFEETHEEPEDRKEKVFRHLTPSVFQKFYSDYMNPGQEDPEGGSEGWSIRRIIRKLLLPVLLTILCIVASGNNLIVLTFPCIKIVRDSWPALDIKKTLNWMLMHKAI